MARKKRLGAELVQRKGVAEFSSLVSLLYTQVKVECKTLQIAIIRRFELQERQYNISGKKTYILILYIRIHCIIAELSRAKLAQRSTIGNKIW